MGRDCFSTILSKGLPFFLDHLIKKQLIKETNLLLKVNWFTHESAKSLVQELNQLKKT